MTTTSKPARYEVTIHGHTSNVKDTYLHAPTLRDALGAIRDAHSWAAQYQGRVCLRDEGRGEYTIILPGIQSRHATVRRWDAERGSYVRI